MQRQNFVVVVALLVGCSSKGETPTPPATEVAAFTGPRIAITPMAMMAMADAPPPRQVEAPWSLTASDGSGLELRRVDARAVVEGPLAYTELHLYFHNPEDRVREGTFSITLPSGAAVSRFAMVSDGTWKEAEVVDRVVARRAYDDFLHRKQDPALLEKAPGNQFSARVFPIPANADKHLVVSFSQELVGRAYSLPLRGLPKVAQIDVTLRGEKLDGTPANQTLSQKDWVPDEDFVATAPEAPAGVFAGNLAVATLPLVGAAAPTAAAEPPRAVTLLVDTSASRGLGFAAYVASIHELIGEMRKAYGDPIALQVVAFDQDTETIFDGAAAEYGDKQDAALIARGAAGASNLAQAIATLATDPHLQRRVVVVTDGVITAGPDTPALVAALENLPIDRVDVVLAGGIRDEQLANTLVHTRLAHPGDVYDLDRGAASVADGLGEPVLTNVTIEVAGASWVYPTTIPAARPGSTLMVYARMNQPTQALEVTLAGDKRTIGLAEATPPLIDRAVAGAEIEEMEAKLATTEDAAAAQTVRGDIAKRSTEARVLSSQTSMLVLESDDDYRRYGIERSALADILVIGDTGIERVHRAQPKPAPIAKAPEGSTTSEEDPPPPPPEKADDDDGSGGTGTAMALDEGKMGKKDSDRAAGQYKMQNAGDESSGVDDRDIQGGLLDQEGSGFGSAGFGPGGGGAGSGTIGHGNGTGVGYGVGGGRGGMHGRTAAVPRVQLGQPTVRGGHLDAAVVRRYLRRNLSKLTDCYEKQLLSNATLAGTITADFVIGGDGSVAQSDASGVDPTVSTCVAGVIHEIAFPHPSDRALVKLSWPMRLDLGDDAPADVDSTSAPDEPAKPFDPDAPAPPEETDDSDDSGSSSDDDPRAAPLTGKLADVMDALHAGKTARALELAEAWHAEDPGDVLALIGLGEILEVKKDTARAARIYGSIIDLYGARADFRRFAGERLERLGASALPLAIDTYRRAVADRPDHLTGHRLLAYALLRAGDYAGAYAAILAGVDQPYPDDRFLGGDRVLREDTGMIAAVWLAHGGKKDDIYKELVKREIYLARQPSTRFIMYWETDDNDVDFHIRDSRGGHAWYSHKALRSGGRLYADITTGYGPECFAIPGTPKAGPYQLSINYYSQGPMGYGMGLLQIQRFDGKSIELEARPYVIMTDHAFVDLGTFR